MLATCTCIDASMKMDCFGEFKFGTSSPARNVPLVARISNAEIVEKLDIPSFDDATKAVNFISEIIEQELHAQRGESGLTIRILGPATTT